MHARWLHEASAGGVSTTNPQERDSACELPHPRLPMSAPQGHLRLLAHAWIFSGFFIFRTHCSDAFPPVILTLTVAHDVYPSMFRPPTQKDFLVSLENGSFGGHYSAKSISSSKISDHFI